MLNLKPRDSGNLYGTGTGFSANNPLVIHTSILTDGMKAEMKYLQWRFGPENKRWRVVRREYLRWENCLLDKFEIEIFGSGMLDFHFDITAFAARKKVPEESVTVWEWLTGEKLDEALYATHLPRVYFVA